MSKPLKPSTSIPEQVETLRSRGMVIDEALAYQWLKNVSYYRLSAYWYPARIFNEDGQRSDQLQIGTRFSDVVSLYEADRKLRTLIHDGVERIEIMLRARIGEHLVASDPLAYQDPKYFRDNFNHTQWLEMAHKRVKRASRGNEAIKHYKSQYNEQYPFWVLAEVLDFSDISRLYDGMFAKDQRTIAEGLGIRPDLASLSRGQQEKLKKQSPLARWLEQLTIIRNICAHHSRLWNKSFTPAPTSALRTQEKFLLLPEGQSEDLFGALLVMTHLLQLASPGTTWTHKVTTLIKDDFLSNPLVSQQALGLPDQWESALDFL